MLLYVNELMAHPNVVPMNNDQFAWYLRMLFRAWMNEPPCKLKNNDEDLMLAAGCGDKDKWEEKKSLVLKNWIPCNRGKYLYNNRLQEEFDKMLLTSEKRKDAGKKGGRPKAIAKPALVDLKQKEAIVKPGKAIEIEIEIEKDIKPNTKPSATRPDSRHSQTKDFIKRCCEYAKVPFLWDASEAKALSSWLQASGQIGQTAIEQLVRNRFRSKDPPGQRPRVWIPQLSSYTTPLNEFNKPETSNGTTSKAQQRNIGNLQNIAQGFGVDPDADPSGGEREDHSDPADGRTLEGSTKPV